MFAIDDSASIFCARVMRGTWSIAIALMPRAASWLTSAEFCAGYRKLINVCMYAQPRCLILQRRSDFHDNVGTPRARRIPDCRSRPLIRAIVKPRGESRARFDDNVKTKLFEFCN